MAATSYEARAFGVRSALPSVTALRRCPDQGQSGVLGEGEVGQDVEGLEYEANPIPAHKSAGVIV